MKAEKIVKNVQLLGANLPSSKYSILTFLILPMHLHFFFAIDCKGAPNHHNFIRKQFLKYFM